MRERISALMDGELEGSELRASLASLLERDAAAQDAWRHYHLIGDALERAFPLSPGFETRVAARLEAEPTVLAPAVVVAPRERRRWVVLSAAASFAAFALVGWLALGHQRGTVPVPPQVAQVAPAAPRTLARVALAPRAASHAPVRVPLPREADDYLLAHQSYSLRGSLQGMMPYVRTVAIENPTGRP